MKRSQLQHKGSDIDSLYYRFCVGSAICPLCPKNKADIRLVISNGEPASESPAFRADKVYVKNHWASNETLGTNGQDPTVNDASNPVAVATVEVTDRQWRTPLLHAQDSPDSIRNTPNSPSELRDRLLTVSDSDDYPLLKR